MCIKALFMGFFLLLKNFIQQCINRPIFCLNICTIACLVKWCPLSFIVVTCIRWFPFHLWLWHAFRWFHILSRFKWWNVQLYVWNHFALHIATLSISCKTVRCGDTVVKISLMVNWFVCWQNLIDQGTLAFLGHKLGPIPFAKKYIFSPFWWKLVS